MLPTVREEVSLICVCFLKLHALCSLGHHANQRMQAATGGLMRIKENVNEKCVEVNDMANLVKPVPMNQTFPVAFRIIYSVHNDIDSA